MATVVRIRKMVLDRWIIVLATEEPDHEAWTGMKFAEIDQMGLSRTHQICNFDEKAEASQFAHELGFEIEGG